MVQSETGLQSNLWRVMDVHWLFPSNQEKIIPKARHIEMSIYVIHPRIVEALTAAQKKL